MNSCNDDVSSHLIDHHLSRGSASERELISGLLMITEEQMENISAFPALITLYSGKVLPSFENLPVSETSRYGEHMLLILLLFKGTPNRLCGATFAEFFFNVSFPWFYPYPITTRKLHAEANRGKRDWKTIAFPRSAVSACYDCQGFYYFIGWRLTVWALCWHNSQRRRDMFVTLFKAKTRTTISIRFFLFKWINRVCTCRIDEFPQKRVGNCF